MKADLAAGDVKMTLQQRQNGTFTGARRPADTQHLPRLEGKINLLQRRFTRLRIDEVADGNLQDTAACRHCFSTVVHRWRLFEHRADTAIGRATALNNVKHPRQRQHRPDHQAKIHHKAGQLAQRQAAVDHHPAAAADSQQVSGPNGDIDGGVETRVNACHAHIFRAGIGGIGGKLRRLAILQPKSLNHADAGQALLCAIVKAGKGRLGHAKTFVKRIAVAFNRQRHQRHRQQRQQGELPANLRRHHNQYRTAHHHRIHQG